MDIASDIAFFVQLVKFGSLSALAREIGVTPPAVSIRLSQIEERLGVRLLNRTTRSLSVTQEGEIYLTEGARLLTEFENLDRQVSASRTEPKGLLRVNATLGFGRFHIAPAVAAFTRKYPEVTAQLILTERQANLVDDRFDVGIVFGGIADSRIIARRIAPNRRFLCAAPSYLARAGEPATPKDLQRHQCIVLRDDVEAIGTWRLKRGRKQENIKVHGTLSSNDGEAALSWALEGHGIVIRSEWDVQTHLSSGALKIVLPEWSPPVADIYAVYLERTHLSAKVRTFIDFLTRWFEAPDWREKRKLQQAEKQAKSARQ